MKWQTSSKIENLIIFDVTSWGRWSTFSTVHWSFSEKKIDFWRNSRVQTM